MADSLRAAAGLEHDLRGIFGDRLQSLVVYGPAARARARGGHSAAAHAHDDAATPTLVVVTALTADDLRACSGRVQAWHDAGLSTPLMLAAHEFGRALDAFPFEFGAILANHVVVAGNNPFEGLAVDPQDLRRASEIQAR